MFYELKKMMDWGHARRWGQESECWQSIPKYGTINAPFMSDAIGETTPLISSAGMSTRAVPSYSSAPSAGGAGASSSGLSSDQEKDGRFTCNICLDSVTDPVTTLCGHLFCWPCLYRWLETHHTTCPVCLAGVSRENGIPSHTHTHRYLIAHCMRNRAVIPLFIKGSEDDPRTKAPASDVPSRPNAQRPEAPARTSANGAGNAAPHFGGMSFTAGIRSDAEACLDRTLG